VIPEKKWKPCDFIIKW